MKWFHPWAFFCVLLLAWVGTACAHEVRPAHLEISETQSGALQVTWKQPFMGDLGIHLVPHLSSGWLDQPPTDRYAAGSYLITNWRLPSPGESGLSGQTVHIEGLEGQMTDVLVRVRFSNGAQQEALLRGGASDVRLDDRRDKGGDRFRFVVLGVEHILKGPDHLLFVLALVLVVSGRRKLIATITGFTVAHSLTLGVASLLELNLSTPLINLLVALSILFVAPEILRAQAGGRSLTTEWPWIVAFVFGLLHGFGFATGLAGLGLDRDELLWALLQFNGGVELAQLAFLAVVLLLMRSFRLMEIRWPRPAFRAPAYVVGVSGGVWVLQYGAAVFSA